MNRLRKERREIRTNKSQKKFAIFLWKHSVNKRCIDDDDGADLAKLQFHKAGFLF